MSFYLLVDWAGVTNKGWFSYREAAADHHGQLDPLEREGLTPPQGAGKEATHRGDHRLPVVREHELS